MKVIIIAIISVIMIFLTSCSNDAEPLPSVTHPEGWNLPEAENFHGNKVLTIGSEFCISCHGADYSGGESGVACADCHPTFPHPPTWSTPGSDSSHAAYLKSSIIYWDMDRCKDCHGEDYRGGVSGVSCYLCHTNPGGPEACNTCHGTSAAPVADIVNWAPPEDLDDNLETTAVGVGAHQNHLGDSDLTEAYTKDCNICHPNILTFDDPLHINMDIDMEFNKVATDSGRVTPGWELSSTSCSNSYCHGNFTFRQDVSQNQWGYADSVITGNNVSVNWTDVGSGQAACGTCHDLPPQGHITAVTCDGCHDDVVDSEFNIIDKNLHMNRKYDIRGNSYRP